MKVYRQDKKNFSAFLNKVRNFFELIAPVKTDLVRFEKITNVHDVFLGKNSYFPIKEFFFKKHEVLFQFDGKKTKVKIPKTLPRVFFGLRRCDLNGVKHQDIAFGEVNDPYYNNARMNSYLIGYHCNKAPSEYCFCGSMNLIDFFDLMFYDKGNYFLIEVGSRKGEFLINKFKRYFMQTKKTISDKEKIIPGADRLETKDISYLYDHPNWKKGVDICLSCGACTALCPTCYCFSIYDEVSSENMSKIERKRDWSSCQLPEFTRVAADYIFRKNREDRFKHRIYHQLQYFKEKHGINLCVGCGRCIEGCPTRIDFVKIINEMKNDKAKS